jgi:2-C-methyl-D-erythritol 4-phosphate cytidylyltransferase
VKPRVGVILLAGGGGERIGSQVNKVFRPLGGRALLWYPLDALARSDLVVSTTIVHRETDRLELLRLLSYFPKLDPVLVKGGATRHQSERAGLAALAPAIKGAEIDLVAIHDGARPFMTVDLFEACVQAAACHGGAVPGLAPEGPIYRSEAGRAKSLEGVAVMQTPQVFRAGPLLAAYERADREGVDTAETVERYSDLAVAMVPGDPDNFKVTFPGDLERAEARAAFWVDGRWRAS